MPTVTTSIGSAPAEEPCAQLCVTRSYERYGLLEGLVYRAAVIAVFGPPPLGVRLRVEGRPHDFGRYYDLLAFHEEGEADAEAYVCRIQDGLTRWMDAGFLPPILYDAKSQVRDAVQCWSHSVRRAILTLERQRIEGYGTCDEAAMIAHLRSAYPAQATEADQLLRQIATETAIRPPSARRIGLFAPYRLVLMPALFQSYRDPRAPASDVIDITARERRSARDGHRYLHVDLGSVATLDQALELCWEHLARYVIP